MKMMKMIIMSPDVESYASGDKFPKEWVPEGIHIMNGPSSLIYEDTKEVVYGDVDYSRDTKTIMAFTRRIFPAVRLDNGKLPTEEQIKYCLGQLKTLKYTHFYALQFGQDFTAIRGKEVR